MNNALKQTFINYLGDEFPGSDIAGETPFQYPVHIRFELGDNLKNGSKKRVLQATSKALSIFNDIFIDPSAEIWILIHEFQEPNAFGANNQYLHSLFDYDTVTNFFTEDNVNPDGSLKIILGKTQIRKIDVSHILEAIANTEMGFDPGVGQKVFFIDPIKNIGFYM